MRLRQYKRREQMTIWVAAGIAGLIGLVAADVIPASPCIFKPLIVTLILLSGGTIAMARVQFEWYATLIERKIADKVVNTDDELPRSEGWPHRAELYWLISLFAIIATSSLTIVAVWWNLIKPLVYK